MADKFRSQSTSLSSHILQKLLYCQSSQQMNMANLDLPFSCQHKEVKNNLSFGLEGHMETQHKRLDTAFCYIVEPAPI